MGPPRIRVVSEQDIRSRFNALYGRRVADGELREEVEVDLPFPPQKCIQYKLPPGTRSQQVAYYDVRRKVAVVHRFLQPSGTLGASGLPDPKEILVGDEIWRIK